LNSAAVIVRGMRPPRDYEGDHVDRRTGTVKDGSVGTCSGV
jgi:hypothetical protein